MDKITRIVVLPDIHTPNEETKALKPIFSFLKFYKPDIFIQLGDFSDWDSVSSFEVRKEKDIQTIETEIKAANKLLDQIDATLPKKCKKVMLGGNHEDRYEKFRANNGFFLSIRRMKDFTSWQEEYQLKKRGWEAHDYGKHFTVGKIVFTHGWFAAGSAAKKMAECFPGRSVIFGHTHRHLLYTCADEKGLPIESESLGTLSKFDLAYLKGKPPIDWVHMFMAIDMMPDGSYTKHAINVIDGKFVSHGKIFQ